MRDSAQPDDIKHLRVMLGYGLDPTVLQRDGRRMVKFFGIFVMSTQLLVAIDGHPSERSFSNSRAGVERLIDYLDENIEPAPNGIFFLVGWLDDSAPQEAIIEMLHELDLKYSLVFPKEIQEASPDFATGSGWAVIEAYKLRRSRILGLK